MKPYLKTLLLMGTLGCSALMTSCQTTAAAAPTHAVTCDKCKTVWVQHAEPSGGGGKGFLTMKSDKAMTCPDCESAVVTFFKTGELKHSCKHCGGTMNHCSTH